MNVRVVKQWKHRSYDEDTTDSDIGLMKLGEKLQFAQYAGTISPVCLPTSHEKYYRLQAVVAGWGDQVPLRILVGWLQG